MWKRHKSVSLLDVDSIVDGKSRRDEDDRGEEEEEGSREEGGVVASSSDPSGLGGRDACMRASRRSMVASTSLLSTLVIRSRATSKGRRGSEEGPRGEWEQEEEDEGEGVSRGAERRAPVSSPGRRVVSMEEVARRDGGREASEGWE